MPRTHRCSGASRPSRASIALAVAAMVTSRGHAFQPPIAGTQTPAPATVLRAHEPSPRTPSKHRRDIIRRSSAAVASALLPVPPAWASEPPSQSEPYTRTPSPDSKFKFGYAVTPPPSFVPSNKPLKTHLDEINFAPPDGPRGYSVGITVDPVRISTIREFGTPEEVAAKVVTAEVNRDGVFEVTLARDPREDAEAGCYDIEYISDGKRGTKRFITRIYVRGGFLYVLTAQSKEGEYDGVREAELAECVRSFRPL